MTQKFIYKITKCKGWPYKDLPNKKHYELCRSFNDIESENYDDHSWLLLKCSNDRKELEQLMKQYDPTTASAKCEDIKLKG
jgi:hypothetical protein|tara:strand:- start:1014 stop:1256 length:243 start_codon:yes stop_codon:yes gene_type:complete